MVPSHRARNGSDCIVVSDRDDFGVSPVNLHAGRVNLNVYLNVEAIVAPVQVRSIWKMVPAVHRAYWVRASNSPVNVPVTVGTAARFGARFKPADVAHIRRRSVFRPRSKSIDTSDRQYSAELMFPASIVQSHVVADETVAADPAETLVISVWASQSHFN